MADTTKIAADIRELLKALGPEGRSYKGILQSLEQTNAGVDEYKTLLENVRGVLNDLNNDLDNTFNSWKNINNELNKAYSSVSLTKKGFGEYYKISNQLLYNQQNLSSVSKKELESLQKKAELNAKILKQQFDSLKAKKDSVGLDPKEEAAYKNLEGAFQNITGEIDVTNNALQRQLKDVEAINGAVGLTGNIFKGISQIPGLSKISGYLNVDKANETMKEYAASQLETVRNSDDYQKRLGRINNLLETGNLTEKRKEILIKERDKLEQEARNKVNNGLTKTITLFKGLNELGKGFYKALLDPATLLLMIAKQAGKIDAEIVSFQKSLNLSRDEATNLRKELALAAYQSNTNFLTTSDLVKAQNNYNNLLGIQGKINTKNLETQARLVELVGVSGESAAKLQYYSEATGQNFETNYKSSLRTTHELSKQYGVQINSKKVLEDVGKTSSYNLVQFRGSTTALTEAVAKAQALGTTLEGVNKISQTLLNFQSSIESELEAELLTGKQLNLEQARYYALTNQTSKLMDELVKNVGTFNEFSKMNVIEQEAYAKSLGMSVGEMSDMLLKQEYLGKNGEIIKNTTDEELQNRLEQLSTQEKFNKSMEKLQGIIGDLVAGPLGDFLSFIGKILESTTGLSIVLGTIVGVQMLKFIAQIPQIIAGFKALKIQALGTAIANMISNAFKSTSWLGPAGFLAASALIGGGIGYIIGQSRKAEAAGDMLSPAKGKTMVSTKEGGLFELSPNDDLVAAPGISNKIGKSKESTSIMSPSINMQPLIDEMAAVRTILTSILNKEGNVSIDGNIVGKTLALAQYNTGS
jgi:hypothetical protein